MAYDAATRFADKNQIHPPILTLTGDTGVGKTHLAVAVGIARALQVCGQVLYFRAEDLCDWLRAGYDDYGSYSERMSQLEAIGLLIIDDLGMERTTPWVESKLDQIIDYRYGVEKDLVVTTNSGTWQLSPRVVSRLKSGVVISMEGKDARLPEGC